MGLPKKMSNAQLKYLIFIESTRKLWRDRERDRERERDMEQERERKKERGKEMDRKIKDGKKSHTKLRSMTIVFTKVLS